MRMLLIVSYTVPGALYKINAVINFYFKKTYINKEDEGSSDNNWIMFANF